MPAQAVMVAALMALLYLRTGYHVVPYWPEARGSAGEAFIVILHNAVIAYGGSLFLVGYDRYGSDARVGVQCVPRVTRVEQTQNGLHWMSSLCVDCSLRLLADRVAEAGCWRELAPCVRTHQRLQAGIAGVQVSPAAVP